MEILVVTAPSACVLRDQESFDLTRRFNTYIHSRALKQESGEIRSVCCSARLLDTEAALEEA